MNATQLAELDIPLGALASAVGQARPAAFSLETLTADDATAAQVVEIRKVPDTPKAYGSWLAGNAKSSNGCRRGGVRKRVGSGLDNDNSLTTQFAEEKLPHESTVVDVEPFRCGN